MTSSEIEAGITGPATTASDKAVATPSNALVLVVDDDPRIRQLLGWALEDEGVATVMAADGREAVYLLTESRPALMVLDMGLPLLSGEEVAILARMTHGIALPIVIMTADGRAVEKAQRIGAIAYFHKPFDVEALITVVRQALQAD